MSVPIHKACYRCSRPVADLVDPADALGGLCGVCADCHLTLGAREVARKWHALHPEAAGVLTAKGAKSEAGEGPDVPRGMNLPAGEASEVLPTDHTENTEGKTNL